MSTASSSQGEDRELHVARLVRLLDEQLPENSPGNSADCKSDQDDLASLDERQRQQLEEAAECLEVLNVFRYFRERSTISDGESAQATVQIDIPNRDDDFPEQLGRYKIIRQLGQGGFSRVFLALDTQLERQVALKIPTLSFLISKESRIRFDREAKAAALLDHPAIVPIYESGSVGSVHFIAMAFCDGPTLCEWLENRTEPNSPELATEILIRLANAIQHAHQRGIVHRDLKPGNILIDRSSKAGGPSISACLRISDFGMAFWHDLDQQKLTREGAVVGTPAYMAPEQARGDAAIGPAADVYALGVIFYQLLTGQLPILGESYLQTLQMIESHQPRSPRSINPRLPRDLEAIALKCLQKDPARRYSTGFELEQDLQRWRDGFPVQARIATPLEKLSRWSRRNPMIAASIVFAFASLLLGIVIAGWKWGEAVADKQLAISAKQQADRAAQRTEDAFNVMLQSFQRFREEQATEVKAVDVLLGARADLQVALENDPLGKARLLDAIGNSFRGLSDYTNAIEAGVESVRLYREHLGVQHLVTLQAIDNLATTYRHAGHLAQSFRILEETRTELKQQFGDHHALTLEAMENLGIGYRDGGRVKEAIAILEKVLAGRTALFGLEDRLTLDAMHALAVSYVEGALHDSAIDLFKTEQELTGRMSQIDIRHQIDSLQQLARAYQGVRRFDDAVDMVAESWEMAKQHYGGDHYESLEAQRLLGFALRRAHKHDECLQLFEQLLEERTLKHGPLHRDTLNAMRDLGVAHGWYEQREEALPIFEKTLELMKQQLGATHKDSLATMLDLVVTHFKLQQYELAETKGLRLVALIGQSEFPDRQFEMLTKSHLAYIYLATNRPEKALPLCQQRHDYYQHEALAESPASVVTRRQLQNVLIELKRFEEAEPLIREFLHTQKQLEVDHLPGHAYGYAALAASLEGQARFEEARQAAEKALQHPRITWVQKRRANGILGMVKAHESEFDEAKRLLDTGLFSLEELPHQRGFLALRSCERMIQWCELAGKVEEAKEWRRKLEEMKNQRLSIRNSMPN